MATLQEPPSPPPGVRLAAIVALFAGVIVLETMWTSAEILLPLIGSSFGVGVGQLGLVVAGFPIGYAATSLPSGLAVLRWGHRTTLAVGLIVMGAAGLVSIAATSSGELALLRIAAGAGGGLFFAPSMAFQAELLPPRIRSLVLGLFVSTGLGFGGALGFVLGATWGPTFGWALVFGLVSSLAVAVGVVCAFSLPAVHHPDAPERPTPGLSPAARVLRSRSVWGLSLGFAGLSMAAAVGLDFVSKFLRDVHPGWGISLAGLLGSVALLATIPGSLLGTWASERGRDRRVVGVLLGVLFGSVAVAIPFLNEAELVVEFAVLGLLAGTTLPVFFAMPSHFPEVQGGGSAIAMGVLETSQVFLTGLAAPLFAFGVLWSGYTWTWVAFGVLAIATLPALGWVVPNRALRSAP
ncbi:MAG: MFS transporter [Thermoplasmata archaeon]|nr:MFS transporter [Thermoplasmata archaeon]